MAQRSHSTSPINEAREAPAASSMPSERRDYLPAARRFAIPAIVVLSLSLGFGTFFLAKPLPHTAACSTWVGVLSSVMGWTCVNRIS